ncbi:Cysteine-rich receptor-like protein kinase 26 [Morella rubra]|uniref:Cysteine-rich receptor-like protein kinase 26 n=1 Tax=Morella rubra TaxID=262757 RepID=A0A6A1ULR4_9ROSI|nr:Cysteine-rich receptor-like protein kinase 26 [Morella rubra]
MKRPILLLYPNIISCVSLDETRGLQFLGFESFDFGTIKVATQNFSEACKLGEDEFGIVYKGTLPGGAVIAVKRLVRDHEPRNTEFENEDIPEPIQRANFNWEMRYKIIKGAAEGILYLQNNFQVCSHDLKASTILLDEEMNPKISAFGLGSLFALYPIEETERTVAGTNGYLVPQNEMLRLFSKKSNVYKFGILVLEIVSAQRNSCFQNGENGEDLLSYVWRKWTERAPSNVVDPSLEPVSTTQQDTIMRCIQIGLLCVQKNVAGLPTLDLVNDMLNRRSSVNLPLPSQPATLLPDSSTESEMSSGGGHNTEVTESTLSKRQPKRGPSQKEETPSNLQPKRAPSLRSTLVRALRKLKVRGHLWKCNTFVARDHAP